MKKIIATVIAGILFGGIVLGIHTSACNELPEKNKYTGSWISYEKDASYYFLKKNIMKDTILYLGSSEFHHFTNSTCHPANIFNRKGLNVMCIGGVVNQSINHAFLLAALGPELESRKVIMLVSPTWFYSHRDSLKRNGMTLTRDFYNMAVNNNNLNDATRENLVKAGKIAYGKDMPDSGIEKEKGLIRTVIAWNSNGRLAVKRKQDNVEHRPIDFNYLHKKVDRKSESKCNERYNAYRNSRIMTRMVIRKSKGKNVGRDFESSKEYDYLRLMIKVCKDQNIDLTLVVLPLNGKWYDYTGLDHETRDICYSNIKTVAGEENVNVIDFSSEEYTPGFFLDAVHPSEKGWLMINEKVYEIIKSN